MSATESNQDTATATAPMADLIAGAAIRLAGTSGWRTLPLACPQP